MHFCFIKDDLQVVLLLSCLVGHPVPQSKPHDLKDKKKYFYVLFILKK